MNKQARLIIGGLAALVVILSGALIAVAVDGDDHGGSTNDAYMGMMRSMGDMDSNGMLQNMKTALGEDGYQGMMAHFRDHMSGNMAGNAAVDNMMHGMMDGMMSRIPADAGGMLPRHGMWNLPTSTPTARP